jgi:hypothetical protein
MKKICTVATFVSVFLLLINNYADGAIGGYSVNLASDEWEAFVDTQVQIAADLTNNQDRAQSFAYLVQIQDENGVTISLSWITGLLEPGQFMSPSQSWTPTILGKYTAQIFVWESVDNPDALSVPLTIKINVVETRNT